MSTATPINDQRSELLVDIKNNIAFLTINRPQALNALSFEMLKAMRALFDAWARDASIYAVVMRGAGEKAFCAGGDVRGLYASVTGTGPRVHEEFFSVEYTLNYQIHQFLKNTGKPVIALMNGIVMGGGMGVAQGATLRIVGERTKMAMPETKIGLFPDVGGTYFLSRATNDTGLYLGLTSNVIDGADACFAKLADLYMTSEAINAFVAAIETQAWDLNHLGAMVSLAKQYASEPPASALAARDANITRHFASQLTVASIITSLRAETDEAARDWANKIADDLELRSPTLMEVTKRQIERGHKMALADCLRLEYNMMARVFEHPDVVEGIRALAIDKDNQPKWNPPTLDEVSYELVQSFFTPRWSATEHPLATLEALLG
jgi:enoyl-CoA hydratase/carnithine racemase